MTQSGDAHRCTVLVDGGAEAATFTVRAGERVLQEMIRAADHSLPVGCRGGGCGACRIRVISGRYTTKRMSRAHVSEADERRGFVLACRLVPTTDLVVERAPRGAADRPLSAPRSRLVHNP